MIESFKISDFNRNRQPKEGNTSIIFSELKDFETEVKSHSLSLKYTISGSEIYHLGKKSFNITEGNFLITPPKQKLEATVKGSTIAKAICLHFDNKIVNEAYHSLIKSIDIESIDKNFTAEEFIPLHLKNSEHQLHHTLTFLAQNDLDLHSRNENIMQICMNVCKSQLDAKNQYTRLRAIKLSTQTEIIQRLYKARHFIQDFCLTNIDLQTIAETVFLSKFHLLRYFKDAFNVTPHQYLMHCRLEKSLELVKYTSLSIAEIAKKTGFADAPVFSKAFKKKYGFSPSKK
jgi:AraC family transcriptional regulator